MLVVNEDFYLTGFFDKDVSDLVKHLSEKQIYDNTLAIPYPYMESDARWWIDFNIEKVKSQKNIITNWAIRRTDNDELVGGIGFMNLNPGTAHQAEFGYWLAKPYWGKGLMTESTKVVLDCAFHQLDLIRVTANVFDFNLASSRVLEKSGFQFEGVLRCNYKKDGKVFDGKLYSCIHPNYRK